MSSHIEWGSARYTQVAGIAHAGEFVNDDIENEAACIVLTDESGNGVCIEGPPDDLVSLAHRILNAAHGVKSDVNSDPELRRMYGVPAPLDSPEPSVVLEEMGRQVLDDQYFEPEYDDGSGR